MVLIVRLLVSHAVFIADKLRVSPNFSFIRLLASALHNARGNTRLFVRFSSLPAVLPCDWSAEALSPPLLGKDRQGQSVLRIPIQRWPLTVFGSRRPVLMFAIHSVKWFQSSKPTSFVTKPPQDLICYQRRLWQRLPWRSLTVKATESGTPPKWEGISCFQ